MWDKNIEKLYIHNGGSFEPPPVYDWVKENFEKKLSPLVCFKNGQYVVNHFSKELYSIYCETLIPRELWNA